jgi:taurine dioxygenase
MVLWDNWRTMHMAFGTPPEYDREVHRTSIRGEYEMGRLL